MIDDNRKSRDVVLIGCGKMGAALLQGWIGSHGTTSKFHVHERAPSAWLEQQDVNLNSPLPDDPAVVVIATKPNHLKDAAISLRSHIGRETVVVSLAAGVTISDIESCLPERSAVIRVMPNTPVEVQKGISAISCNGSTKRNQLELVEALFRSVGKVVRLDDEIQFDVVTALSGSGPAYVFLFIEALANAGELNGLPPKLALDLAKATVLGAGDLADQSLDTPAVLRKNVTSPGGTTQAALDVLMNKISGLFPILNVAVKAAALRSRQISDEI